MEVRSPPRHFVALSTASPRTHHKSELMEEEMNFVFCEDRMAFLEEQLQQQTIMHGSSLRIWSATREIYAELDKARAEADHAIEVLTARTSATKGANEEGLLHRLPADLQVGCLSSTSSTPSQVDCVEEVACVLSARSDGSRCSAFTASTTTPLSANSDASSYSPALSFSDISECSSHEGKPSPGTGPRDLVSVTASSEHHCTVSKSGVGSSWIVDSAIFDGVQNEEEKMLPPSIFPEPRYAKTESELFGSTPRASLVSLRSCGTTGTHDGATTESADSGCSPGSTLDRVWHEFRAAKEAAADRRSHAPEWSTAKRMWM
eukprot:gnl/TRDRNA2_/TRDRNA2_204642_c0_seq1.p1 gnl/TRDRNA2_/TRDRNA2_204642_c0~~gnl/TRDRNA2_/TRDRNA2_204642_c0_seq1.p1  ORF type:complete len:319 (+),score=48.93 gnl/TRDRNA2_/TRDRNA2_204642_c0_seq1:173-1129(+)